MAIHFLTGDETDRRSGICKSVRYARSADGRFIQPVKLGKRSLYPEHEVEAINRAVLRGVTDDELRALVVQLHAARKDAGSVAA